MDWTGIIWAAAIVGGTGLIIGLLLGIAGRKFAIKVNEMEVAVRETLPGNNCGGPGCSDCFRQGAGGWLPGGRRGCGWKDCTDHGSAGEGA